MQYFTKISFCFISILLHKLYALLEVQKKSTKYVNILEKTNHDGSNIYVYLSYLQF